MMGRNWPKTLLGLRMKGPDRMRRNRWDEMPEWVFATRSGEPPDGQHVREIFRKVLREAGLPRHHTPTRCGIRLRRSCSSGARARPGSNSNLVRPASCSRSTPTAAGCPRDPLREERCCWKASRTGYKLETEALEMAGKAPKALGFLH